MSAESGSELKIPPAGRMENEQEQNSSKMEKPTTIKTCQSRIQRVDGGSLAVLPHPYQRDLMSPWPTTKLTRGKEVRITRTHSPMLMPMDTGESDAGERTSKD